MDILRRNTDYALRAMVHLAAHNGSEPVSTRALSDKQEIPYQLAGKLMQKLHGAKLVESCMGPKGGFRLSSKPAQINVLQVIEAIQGPIRLNRCLLGRHVCPRQDGCPIRPRLAQLQESIGGYLTGITLAELARTAGTAKKRRPRKVKEGGTK
jgi:Rrf2 family protein